MQIIHVNKKKRTRTYLWVFLQVYHILEPIYNLLKSRINTFYIHNNHLDYLLKNVHFIINLTKKKVKRKIIKVQFVSLFQGPLLWRNYWWDLDLNVPHATPISYSYLPWKTKQNKTRKKKLWTIIIKNQETIKKNSEIMNIIPYLII